MLYVYGVVRAGQPSPDVTGVGSPAGDVRLVESGPLAAAVSELPDDIALQDEDARAHLRVLIRLLDDGPVIPLRMGTVAPDDDVVRAEVLDAVRDEMAARLAALDGLVELHVDADDDETEAIAEVARGAGLDGRAATDFGSRLELGEEIAELLIERRRRLAEQIMARLRPHAVQDTPRAVLQGPEDSVLRWAFLVKRDDLEAFDDAVVDVRSAYPSITVRYVGPLPASHFVDWQRTTQSEPVTDNFSAQGSWGW